ncbi:hypothetical protein B566_EDAN004219 [Ephemera danica]|nr:hypothetical protein B566_EDAN004219 [Ephemera danica]
MATEIFVHNLQILWTRSPFILVLEFTHFKMHWLRLGLLLIFWCSTNAAIGPQITLPGMGTIEGTSRSRATMSFRRFDSYRGIPFGKSTGGELRFKASQMAEPWSGVLQTTRYGRPCPQSCPLEGPNAPPVSKTYKFWKNFHEFMGDNLTFAEMDMSNDEVDYEDCLFTHVYTPTRDPDAKLPVMVFYYGGSFEYGSAAGYLPNHFMDYDVILVVPHYRLGSLGLMKGIIAESGAAFAEWAIDPDPVYNARGVAMEMGCNMTSEESINECFMEADPCSVLSAQDSWSNSETKKGLSGFGAGSPTVQTAGSRIFIDKNPRDIWLDPDFVAVPSIYGANKHEGTYVLASITDNGNVVTDSVEYEYVGVERLGNMTAMAPGLIDFGGSTFLKAPGYESNIRHAKFGNSYQYAYNFYGRLTYPICSAIVGTEYVFPPGICHAAEIIMLFGNRISFAAMSPEEQALSQKMVKMWYNFAKYLNPTPPENPVEGVEIWPPYDEENQFYLRFDDNITVQRDYKTNEYTIAKEENFASPGEKHNLLAKMLWLTVHMPGMGIVEGKGFRRATISKRNFDSYMGIPFGKPPSGPLRYKVLPVMVFYYGGSFEYGSAVGYLPNHFMDYDVILVVPHYRLGALGFLSMQNDEIPGNAAMLDQVLALEWVNQYIQYFGGDPENVIIFGESAGAASVSLLALSPLTKGLMKGVIAESGAALAAWAIDPDPVYNAYGVAEQAGCNMTSEESINACFMESDPCTILSAQDEWSNIQGQKGLNGFGAGCPTVQTAGSRIFLDKHPIDIWSDPEFVAVPAIYGANKHEGTYVLAGMPDNGNVVTDSAEYEYLGVERLGNMTAISPGLIDFGGSMFLKAPGYESLIRHAKFGNSYQYAYNFHGRLTTPICNEIVGTDYSFPSGVCHAAEVIMLFGNELTYAAMSPEEQQMMRTMTKMWYNFAKYRNPTPAENPVEGVESWPPYDDVHQYYLRFDSEISAQQDYKTKEYTVAKDENFGL